MRRMTTAGLMLVAAAAMSPPARAESPFDGTWIWDASATELPARPDVYRLQGGRFRCVSCPRPYELVADGKAYPVAGQSSFDAAAVTVDGPRRVRLTTTRSGKPATQISFTLSPDRNGLSTDVTDFSSGTAVTSRILSTRVATAAPAAHALSGSWRQTRLEAALESATTVSLKVTQSHVSFRDPSGFAYDAEFDGRDYPVTGVAPGRTASVRRISDNSFEETQRQDGNIVSIITLTVAPDGKSAAYLFQDLVEGATTKGTLNRKPEPLGDASKAKEDPRL